MIDFKVNLNKHLEMNLVDKKETLMHIVQDADDKLTGLLIALANEYNSPENYSSEELDSFYEIRDALLNEPQTAYTPAKAHEIIRNKKQDAV